MANRIELPGGVQVSPPTPELEALHTIQQQLQQLTIAMNTLVGQVDTALRLGSGAYSKHEVKVKFQEFDAARRIAVAKAAEAQDPALD